MANPLFNRLIFVFSFIGIFLAGYLWYMHAFPEDIPCGPSHGCEDVAKSAYSRFPPAIGPPVAAFGTIGYILLCGLSFYRTLNENVRRDRSLLLGIIIVAALGTLFSLYLTAMEAFVIHAWCKWCLGSQALIALITVLGVVEWLQKPRPSVEIPSKTH